MKKLLSTIFISTLLITLYACSSTDNEPEMAIGSISEKQLLAQYSIFERGFSDFEVTKSNQSIIESWSDELSIEVYFGTWCHDSEREVPKLLKLLSYNTNVTVKLVALDYQKQDPQGLAQTKKVKYTPTIIVYQNDKEIGRIIERPKAGLVKDINQFL